jgi:transposase
VNDYLTYSPTFRAQGILKAAKDDYENEQLFEVRRACPGFVDTLTLSRKEVCTMPRTRPAYPPEYRAQIVELVRAGRSPAELAREFEPSASTIRNWVRQADLDDGLRNDGLTTAEREELRRLRRENRQLRIEREILAKAAAWFARGTGSIPSKGAHS